MQKKLAIRIIGFIASLVLTLLAYGIIVHPDFFHLSVAMAVVTILILALLQSLVQLIFFLYWREDGPPWNLGFFASTVGIIATIIIFSIWIMDHLNYNMMP